MCEGKLIVCVCGAGINTSSNAKMTIEEYLENEGIFDIEVKHITISDMENHRNRSNMVVVWMTQVDSSYNVPSFHGLPYLIGKRKAKEQLTKEIIAKMDEIFREEV